MKIQILGTGCPKCRTLEDNTRKALDLGAISAEIEKVTNLDDIMAMGVMVTPALAIDGEVKVSGKLLTPLEILSLIQG